MMSFNVLSRNLRESSITASYAENRSAQRFVFTNNHLACVICVCCGFVGCWFRSKYLVLWADKKIVFYKLISVSTTYYFYEPT